MWKREDSAKRSSQVLDALQAADNCGTFPCITLLLRIFATLPVTTASSERSFSALKYIKNCLRSTMGNDRLNGLSHLYINRDIKLDYDAVIDEFSVENSRLNFK